jgi:hypothetical protein
VRPAGPSAAAGDAVARGAEDRLDGLGVVAAGLDAGAQLGARVGLTAPAGAGAARHGLVGVAAARSRAGREMPAPESPRG